MTEQKAILIAIECAEGLKKLFSEPKESMLKPRKQEEQHTLTAAIEEIEEALLVLREILTTL